MAKRFTDTGKWGKAWYQDLPAKQKLLWQYLCDNCDCAGFWSVNWRLASFQIGDAVEWADLAVFGDRVAKVDENTLHLTTFVDFQYGHLSEACKAHVPILKAISQRVSKGYPYPTGKGNGKGNGNGKSEESGEPFILPLAGRIAPEVNTEAEELPKPDAKASSEALQALMTAFRIKPLDASLQAIRGNVVELLARGATVDEIADLAAWATDDEVALKAGVPLTATSLTDPARFAGFQSTMRRHLAEIEAERKKRNR